MTHANSLPADPPVTTSERADPGPAPVRAARRLSLTLLRLQQSRRGFLVAAGTVVTHSPVLADRLTRMSDRRREAEAVLADIAVETGIGWEPRRDLAGRIHRTWLRFIGRAGPAAALDECHRGESTLRRALGGLLDSQIPAAVRSHAEWLVEEVTADLRWIESHRASFDSMRDDPRRLLPDQHPPTMPEFRAPASTGQTLDSERYRGKLPLVVFFLPDATSRRAGRRIAEFNRRLGRFGALRTQVIGVIPETARRLRKQAELKGYNLPLLSDPDEAIHRAFGVEALDHPPWPVFVIDTDGRIVARHAVTARPGHVDQILAAVRARRSRSDRMAPALKSEPEPVQ